MSKMRAKVRVSSVNAFENSNNEKVSENLTFNAVAASEYPADGSDENNSYARWTPTASFEIAIQNPALFGTFAVGQEYYVDFEPAAAAAEPIPEAAAA
jgi:hypothetical protein